MQRGGERVLQRGLRQNLAHEEQTRNARARIISAQLIARQRESGAVHPDADKPSAHCDRQNFWFALHAQFRHKQMRARVRSQIIVVREPYMPVARRGRRRSEVGTTLVPLIPSPSPNGRREQRISLSYEERGRG